MFWIFNLSKICSKLICMPISIALSAFWFVFPSRDDDLHSCLELRRRCIPMGTIVNQSFWSQAKLPNLSITSCSVSLFPRLHLCSKRRHKETLEQWVAYSMTVNYDCTKGNFAINMMHCSLQSLSFYKIGRWPPISVKTRALHKRVS